MRRLPVALVASVLTVAALAMPASAAGTRWVDDDGDAGPSGCGGFQSVPQEIQPAIDAAGPGDTIMVCPGSYTGPLDVSGSAKDGLTIQGTTTHGAKVSPPRSGGELTDLLRIHDADRVHIQNLVLAARGDMPCVPVVNMVAIEGSSTGTVIAANRIRVSGTSSAYLDPCGYRYGIYQFYGPRRTRIRHNTVDDWDGAGIGIAVFGDQTTVWRNSLHSRRIDQSGQSDPSGTGIHVGHTATRAVVRGNRVIGLSTAVESGAGTPMLDNGIRVVGTADTVVEDNRVRSVANGILALSGITPVIRDNVVRHSASDGIVLVSVSGASVTDNTTRGSGGFDCRDVEPQGPNTWTDNTGVTSSPSGLCTAP